MSVLYDRLMAPVTRQRFFNRYRNAYKRLASFTGFLADPLVKYIYQIE